jgi:hypothetical protein
MGTLEDPVLGEEQLLGLFGRPPEDGFKILAAVGHHGLGLRSQDFGSYVYRAWNEHR